MATERIIPGEIRIFLNHIYEFKKGVRNMVLYTMSKEHEEFAIRRLKNQKISYMIQEVGTNKINLFFGKAECMEAMRHIIKMCIRDSPETIQPFGTQNPNQKDY